MNIININSLTNKLHTIILSKPKTSIAAVVGVSVLLGVTVATTAGFCFAATPLTIVISGTIVTTACIALGLLFLQKITGTVTTTPIAAAGTEPTRDKIFNALTTIFSLIPIDEFGTTEGVFRISGSKEKKEELVNKLLAHDPRRFMDLSPYSLAEITSAMNELIRQLNIFGGERRERFLNVQNMEDFKPLILEICQSDNQLSTQLFNYLGLLGIAHRNEEKTKMTSYNLATCICLNLVWDNDPQKDVNEMQKIIAATQKLIELNLVL